jgi:membrane-associated phospholipid phosphatase
MYSNIVTVPGVELHTGQTSFPSGHTMAGFGLYSILTLMAGKKKQRWGFALALAAISVGVSRIFLVQHFLPDVLSGALLGLLVSSLVWRLDGTPFFQRMHWLDRHLSWGNKKVDTAGSV